MPVCDPKRSWRQPGYYLKQWGLRSLTNEFIRATIRRINKEVGIPAGYLPASQ